MLYFPGDVAGAHYITSRVINVNKHYTKLNSGYMKAVAIANAVRTGEPFIFIARPGIFGSSGHHGNKARKINADLMNAAVSLIKENHQLEEISIVGQSGGGAIASALLNWRTDIKCAVLASSAGSRIEIHLAKNPGHNISRIKEFIFDPIDHVNQMPHDPKRLIFSITDKADNKVIYWTKKSYADKVKKAGHHIHLIELDAKDRNNHGLGGHGVQLAAACMKNLPVDDITDHVRHNT